MDKEINKDLEIEILTYIDNSEYSWTDLYPFIEKSKYTNPQFYEVLKQLIEENLITDKKETNISNLNLTVKGKPFSTKNLLFRISTDALINRCY